VAVDAVFRYFGPVAGSLVVVAVLWFKLSAMEKRQDEAIEKLEAAVESIQKVSERVARLEERARIEHEVRR
jgi:hypothetical protein